MLAWLDSLWWMDLLAFLLLGVWIGRRWTRVMMEARCEARNCQTIQDMRTDAMKLSADKFKLEQMFDFMRRTLREKDEKIHSLKTSNGIKGKEIEKLTYQIPRPQRRMVG